MRCIFCKCDSVGSRSVEHVIPESLCNLLVHVNRDRGVKFLKHVVRSRDALISAEQERSFDSAVEHIGSALRMV